MQKTISIIVPVYNEEKNIPLINEKILSVFSVLQYNFEIIYINDGSKDNSQKVINDLIATDIRIKSIEFSRNFGKESATSAGLKFSKGDAAIMIDADLDQPPTIVPEFINKWENGFEIIMGLKRKSPKKELFKKIGSKLFYLIMNQISETPNMSRSTDFMLLDRKVIDVFVELKEKGRITRGLILWLGFKQEFIEFDGEARFSGKSNYSYPKLIKLAMHSFLSHSLFPLRIAGYLGLLITFISGTTGLFLFIGQYYFRNIMPVYVSGTAFLALFITFLVGMILVSLGLIALYIGNIHEEILDRPLYIIRNKNF